MYCSNCGKPIDDQAKFCPECGAANGGRPSAAQSVAVQATGSARQQSGSPQTPRQQPQSPGQVPRDQLSTIEGTHGKRSEAYLTCKVPPAQAAEIASGILRENGFSLKDYKGETVWKKGTGMATAMQFVKVAAFDDSLGIQAWTQIGIGDAGLKEQSLDGFVGALPKKMLLKVIEKIQNAV